MSASGKSPTKLAPGTTIRRLPWLDGRTSQAVSTSPPAGDISPATRTSDLAQLSVPAPIPRKNLVSSQNQHRLLESDSPLESSPSPVKQPRRVSVAQQRQSHIPHEPQKRLSVAGTLDPNVDHSNTTEVRARADSLAPLPDHLERSSTSESIQLLTERDVVPKANPIVVSRVQMSPSRPRPGRSAFESTGHRKISNAIENLEDMVQEAVDIVDDSAEHDHVEEIYEIIEGAKQAVQEAAVDPAMRLMEISSPLPASDPSGEMHNVIEVSVNPIPLEVHDWAYQEHNTDSSSSSSRSSSNSRGRSRSNTANDPLLPPDPTQAAPREHVDFVFRSTTRDHSRGRPSQRVMGDRVLRSRRPHRHRHFQNLSSSDREPKQRHYNRQSSESSDHEESFDEEEIAPQPYGQTLRVRDQAHQHTFDRLRSHRRQPIARNWGTGKKRLTATIACINTALLGIIIGVYVRTLVEYDIFRY
ncbi:hypothetical protein B5807_02175 [Epicoccum nigrum]|uniref:Uncharacterized protein n=1 Tax=Epicoccum nigrum TaxID=105696 RepID=A0A1Y2MCD4_EPING|nr:hypothetical protein B5807_02175 [Epicoccum nigrum]